MMAALPSPAQHVAAPPQVHTAAPGLGCILDSGAAKPLMHKHGQVENQISISPEEISGRTAALIGVERCGYPFVNLISLMAQTFRNFLMLSILAVKLRMLLELKRCGRHKCRLNI